MTKKTWLLIVMLTITTAAAAVANSSINMKEYKKGIYLFKLNKTVKITPFVTENLTTNEDIFNQTKSSFVINTGFFDPNNGKTISYVVKYGKTILDPNDNENLTSNPELIKNMAKITNRSELRVLKCNNKIKYDITNHFDYAPEKCEVLHSVQAGPALLPYPKLEEEFFIVKKGSKIVRESASVLHKTARTAVGIKDNTLYFIIVTNDAKMTIEELSELCKELEFEKALAFDGGGSTSVNYKNLKIVSDKDETARKLKSFIIAD